MTRNDHEHPLSRGLDTGLSMMAFAAFAHWHAGNEVQARACWAGMNKGMRRAWYLTAEAVMNATVTVGAEL